MVRVVVFFWITADKKFVVKTISSSEYHLMTNILPQYYQYIFHHPESLIVRLLGAYSFRIFEGPEICFLVMRNMFYTDFPLHFRYDLKGSWEQRTAGEKFRKNPRRTVGKDLDFGDKRIYIPGNFCKTLLDTLQKDCEFLASNQLIDYSLLVGIHDKNFEGTFAGAQPVSKEGTFTRDNYSVKHPSLEGPTIGVFDGVDGSRGVIGIIDILQQFTWRKKAEKFLKVHFLCHEAVCFLSSTSP